MAMFKLDNDKFPKLQTRITRVAFDRLMQACEVRLNAEAMRVSQGRILIELIMAHLPPVPGEQKPPRIAQVRKHRPKPEAAA